MKFFSLLIGVLALSAVHAQPKQKRIYFGVSTSASYQIAANGSKAITNLGNFGFKGYIQPEIGLALKYQQDSTEFAIVAVSASKMAYTLSANTILQNGLSSYSAVDRFDIFMNQYSMKLSYHRCIAHTSPAFSFNVEAGIGLHYFRTYETMTTDDTLIGPYSVVSTLEVEKENYFLPSVEVGLNMLVKPVTSKAQVIFGLRTDLYLDNFSEVNYTSTYTNGTAVSNNHFRWAPTLLVPEIYAAVFF
jgi:hypothetical protein